MSKPTEILIASISWAIGMIFVALILGHWDRQLYTAAMFVLFGLVEWYSGTWKLRIRFVRKPHEKEDDNVHRL